MKKIFPLLLFNFTSLFASYYVLDEERGENLTQVLAFKDELDESFSYSFFIYASNNNKDKLVITILNKKVAVFIEASDERNFYLKKDKNGRYNKVFTDKDMIRFCFEGDLVREELIDNEPFYKLTSSWKRFENNRIMLNVYDTEDFLKNLNTKEEFKVQLSIRGEALKFKLNGFRKLLSKYRETLKAHLK